MPHLPGKGHQNILQYIIDAVVPRLNSHHSSLLAPHLWKATHDYHELLLDTEQLMRTCTLGSGHKASD